MTEGEHIKYKDGSILPTAANIPYISFTNHLVTERLKCSKSNTVKHIRYDRIILSGKR